MEWGLELASEQFGLEEVIIFVELCEFVADMAVLFGHELIEFLSDLVEKQNQKFTVFEAESLYVMLEISWGCEFVLKFFAPFCEQT